MWSLCSWGQMEFHYISFPATRCLCWTRIRTWLMQVLELQCWTFPGYAWTQLEAVKSAVQRWWLEYDDEGYQTALHSKSPFEQMLVFGNLVTYLCQSGAIHHFAKMFHLWLTLHTLRCHLKCKIFSPTWFGWNSHHLQIHVSPFEFVGTDSVKWLFFSTSWFEALPRFRAWRKHEEKCLSYWICIIRWRISDGSSTGLQSHSWWFNRTSGTINSFPLTFANISLLLSVMYHCSQWSLKL
jgi:hypothetical protein